jgi:hypothetical protein
MTAPTEPTGDKGLPMAQASQSIEIAAAADRVWGVVGGFDNLPLWLKIVRRSNLEDGGRVRRLDVADGLVVVERLLSFDEAAMRLTYAHVEAPDPVTDYVAIMAVADLGADRSRVTWSSHFRPLDTSAAATAHLEGIYRTGLADLKALLELR